MQEVQVETLRELFQRLPEVASDRDPVVQAAADRRIERVLDRVAVGSPYVFQKPVQFVASRPRYDCVMDACGIGKPLMPIRSHAS